MKIKILFLSIFLCYSITAQNFEKNVDSLRLEQKYNLLLYNETDINLPLFSIGELHNPYDSPFETDFISQGNPSIMMMNSVAFDKIKHNINSTFLIYRQGESKYHLGVVSDVLGYVVPAAAAGLAVYHVVKYKKYYGIK